MSAFDLLRRNSASGDLSPEVIWRANAGSQSIFLSCPVFEALYGGTRGPGKTDALLVDYGQFVGMGFGAEWKGILFRRTYKELEDIVAKANKLFKPLFGATARFNESDYEWTWNTGETLKLRYLAKEADYWNYHGHSYPWMGFDELTNWMTLGPYLMMHSCCRSTVPNIPRRVRATTNPYGKGHNVVKRRFVTPAPYGTVIRVPNERDRVYIHGTIWENQHLLKNDPDYIKNLFAQTEVNRRKAWLDGSWDINSGGMFDDIWDEKKHKIRPFPIPSNWRIYRAFDWGSSKPYAGLWIARSNGEEVRRPDGTKFWAPKNSRIVIRELYGWGGEENVGTKELAKDVGKKMRIIEGNEPWGKQVRPGAADASIFDSENGVCIADDLWDGGKGVKFIPADKGPGSRKNGWERARAFVQASAEDRPEEPGFYVFDTCVHTCRTFPALPRDELDPDDVDTESEDHIGDVVRYDINTPIRGVSIEELRA
jgi:hypothetical protein